MAFPRLTIDSLSSLFSPSRCPSRTLRSCPWPCPPFPASCPFRADHAPGTATSVLRPRLTSRSAAAASPFQAQGEISPGKNDGLPCTIAGFTAPEPWSRELRGQWPARPARHCLLSGFCSSTRRFATPLRSALRSPSAPCGSLGLLRPALRRTFTSKSSPMLGPPPGRAPHSWRPPMG
jgi:hypothetical protein